MLSLPAVSHPTTLTKIFPLFSTCVCCLVNIVIPFAMQMAPVMPSKQILRLSASPVCLLRPDQLHEHHAVLFCNFFLLCNDYHSYFSCSAHSYHLHCPFFGGKLDWITLYSIVRTKKLHSKCAWVCDLDLNKRKPQPLLRGGKVTGVICHPMQCVWMEAKFCWVFLLMNWGNTVLGSVLVTAFIITELFPVITACKATTICQHFT